VTKPENDGFFDLFAIGLGASAALFVVALIAYLLADLSYWVSGGALFAVVAYSVLSARLKRLRG
jgi:hypothetical protein